MLLAAFLTATVTAGILAVRTYQSQRAASDRLRPTVAVLSQPGKHDWPFADRAFAAALPWLAGRLGTPGVSRTSLPDESPADASSGATVVVVPAQHSNTAPR